MPLTSTKVVKASKLMETTVNFVTEGRIKVANVFMIDLDQRFSSNRIDRHMGLPPHISVDGGNLLFLFLGFPFPTERWRRVGSSADSYAGPTGGEPLAEEMGLFFVW